MDDMLLAVRASPASKAATLSRDSQALVHSLRADLDAAAQGGDSEVRVFPESSTYLHLSRVIIWVWLPEDQIKSYSAEVKASTSEIGKDRAASGQRRIGILGPKNSKVSARRQG